MTTSPVDPPGATPPLSVACLSTADWDSPLWTNKQHLMSRLASQGVRVLYVDSVGHRAPSATAADARRVAHRLAVWRPFARQVAPCLWRDSPLVVPLHGSPPIDAMNRALLRRRLGRNVRHLKLDRPVLWAYSPIAAEVYSPNRYSALVYHCVDDLAQFPGVEPRAFRRMEEKVVRQACVTLVSSRSLERHVESLGALSVTYWPNPADVTTIRNVAPRHRSRSRPLVGFLGAVQDYKLNSQLLRGIAAEMPDVDFVIAGPLGEGIARHGIDVTTFSRNVSFPGLIPRERVPEFLSGLDVGMIPYRLNSYTEAVFPLKVFEYFAAGLPVVATPLPSLVGEVSEILFGADRTQFVEQIRVALACRDDPVGRKRRSEIAESHSWDARCHEALALLARLPHARVAGSAIEPTSRRISPT